MSFIEVAGKLLHMFECARIMALHVSSLATNAGWNRRRPSQAMACTSHVGLSLAAGYLLVISSFTILGC